MKTYFPYNLILPKYLGIVKEFGSGMSKTRAWEGGASVFTNLFLCIFPFVPPSVCPKIPLRLSEGEAEGGCGGNSASPEPKRSHAAPLVQSRVPQKSFLFLLEEKNRRAQIKNCEENFFAEQRAKRAAAGRSVKIRSSDFRQKKFGF